MAKKQKTENSEEKGVFVLVPDFNPTTRIFVPKSKKKMKRFGSLKKNIKIKSKTTSGKAKASTGLKINLKMEHEKAIREFYEFLEKQEIFQTFHDEIEKYTQNLNTVPSVYVKHTLGLTPPEKFLRIFSWEESIQGRHFWELTEDSWLTQYNNVLRI